MGPAETRGKDGPAPTPSRPCLPASLAGQPQWEGSAPWHLSRLWRGGCGGAPGGGRTFLDAEAGGGDLVLDLPHRPPPLPVLPGRHPRVPPAAAHAPSASVRGLSQDFSSHTRLPGERGTPFPGHSKERVPVPSGLSQDFSSYVLEKNLPPECEVETIRRDAGGRGGAGPEPGPRLRRRPRVRARRQAPHGALRPPDQTGRRLTPPGERGPPFPGHSKGTGARSKRGLVSGKLALTGETPVAHPGSLAGRGKGRRHVPSRPCPPPSPPFPAARAPLRAPGAGPSAPKGSRPNTRHLAQRNLELQQDPRSSTEGAAGCGRLQGREARVDRPLGLLGGRGTLGAAPPRDPTRGEAERWPTTPVQCDGLQTEIGLGHSLPRPPL